MLSGWRRKRANTGQILLDLNLVTSSLSDEDYITVMTGTNDITFTNNGQCIGLDMHEEARKEAPSAQRPNPDLDHEKDF